MSLDEAEEMEKMKMIKIIKRLFCAAVCFVFVSVSLAGCGSSEARSGDGKLLIVTTVFPEYDWVMNVLGDNPAGAEVVLLLDDGIDMHNYQPTVDDMVTISSADLFIYVGGESDEWVEDAVKNITNEDAVIINMMETLGDKVYEEETVEGMQESDEHEHGDEDDHEEEEVEYDEHAWLSLNNAQVLTFSFADALAEVDPDNSDLYNSNAEAYVVELQELDERYREAVSSADNKTLLFADRFPFRYLVVDYGLDYYAAFSGCSAETEASFETVIFLAKKADELGLKTVLKIDGSDDDVARTVIDNTSSKDQRILELDSMQSVTSKDIEDGATYLSIMEKNLEVLKEALN